MYTFRNAGIAAGVILGIGVCLLAFGQRCRGVGHFEQPITVVSSKPICLVCCNDATLDAQTRSSLLKYKTPELCESSLKVAEYDGSTYRVPVMFTTDKRGMMPAEVFHRSHLVVFVTFADGKSDVRIADIPPGLGKAPIIVDFD